MAEMILLCEFDQKKCFPNNFKKFQSSSYGNCFTFNHGTMGDEIRQTDKTGSKYGLKMVLNVNQSGLGKFNFNEELKFLKEFSID